MRRLILPGFLFCLLAMTLATEAAEGKVIKVLPHFVDKEGRHTLSPSLYERDAYQAFLRKNPHRIAGVRYDVQWKASGGAFEPLRLKVELRGTARGDLPSKTVLETTVKPGWLSRWNSLSLTGADYSKFGEVTAWRVTLWEGNQMIGEQKSFLW